ncbi:MAG: hypothetical protein ACI81P_000165 [Neolewinella sp.]|jgi:hypothetical protein
MLLKKITLLLIMGVLISICACEKINPFSGEDMDEPILLE